MKVFLDTNVILESVVAGLVEILIHDGIQSNV